MSGFHDTHSQAHRPSSSTTSPLAAPTTTTTTTNSVAKLPQLLNASPAAAAAPFHYSTSPAPSNHIPPSAYPHSGLPTPQQLNVTGNGSSNGNGNGNSSIHSPAHRGPYAVSPTSRLNAPPYQSPPDHHSQHLHQQQQQQQQHLPHPHQHHHQHHQELSPIHYPSNNGNHSATTPTSSHAHSTSETASPPPNKKNTRIPRACDLCSQRKVKCEGGPPPCRPCRELNVACTYDRVKKRRGPPNRAAEAAREAEKRRRLGNDGPTPPLQNAAHALVSLGSPHGQIVMDAEQCIAPLGVLELLVDDFFTYIHPLTPFPHEPTFREAFRNREDRTNPEFLALLASMIGALVASFPRSARLHLKASHSYDKFPRAIMLVDRCVKVALAMRPADLMLKEVLSVNDAAVSYFLCLGAGYTMRWNQCRRFLGESLRFLREMGFHRRRPPPTILSLTSDRQEDQSNDFISDEIGKRIYWCIFLGVRSMSQMGSSARDLIIPPATPNTSYPDFPREVDDAYILADRILPQPEGTVSKLTGFVICAQIYRTMDDIVRIELSHGMSAYTWDQQKQYLHTALLRVKEVAETLPPELRIDMTRHVGINKYEYPQASQDGSSTTSPYRYVPAAYPNNQPTNDVRHLFAQDESKKREVQYEIQKANIYASLLGTRSHYVERYLSLRDVYLANQRAKTQANASGSIVYRTAAEFSSSSLAAAAIQAAAEQANDSIDDMFLTEREEVVQTLFSVLGSIEQCNMEPNGGSLISKIRQVACTLLSDRPDRKGQYELRNEEYLKAFLNILTRLEKTGTGIMPSAAGGGVVVTAQNGDSMTEQDEEQELRDWADLREQQYKMTRERFPD